jgi:thioredoxin reductase (NADPH)
MTHPTPTTDHLYELLILGDGPAGLTAGLYAARSGLDTLLVERPTSGRQPDTTALVQSCPGCVEGPGAANSQRIREQALRFGLRIRTTPIEAVDLTGDEKVVRTSEKTYRAHAVILALDTAPKRLNVSGEDRFWGRGVHLCATCDGPLYMGRTVAVVGGGDAPAQEAMFLARFAARVALIHDRDRLQAQEPLQDRLMANPKITLYLNRTVESIVGDDRVTGVVLRDTTTGTVAQIPVDGIFLYAGHLADTFLVRGQVALDHSGYIRTDAHMRTSQPHVYAAGGVRSGSHRQLVTAAADGAIAAMSAVIDLVDGKRPQGPRRKR